MKSVILRASSKFIWIAPLARNKIRWVDQEDPQSFLPPDVGDNSLGESIISLLKSSREVSVEKMRSLISNSELAENRWADATVKRFNYKSRKALFADICVIEVQETEAGIRIDPFNHPSTSRWTGDGIEKKDCLTVALDSDAVTLGQSIKAVLSNLGSRAKGDLGLTKKRKWPPRDAGA